MRERVRIARIRLPGRRVKTRGRRRSRRRLVRSLVWGLLGFALLVASVGFLEVENHLWAVGCFLAGLGCLGFGMD